MQSRHNFPWPEHVRSALLAISMLALALVLGGASCEPEGPADPDADTALARGRVERTTTNCDGESVVADVLELIDEWLGGDVEVTEECGTYRREIATGVELGDPSGDNPQWNELGGRGDATRDALLCMLADLERAPGHSVSVATPEIATAFGPVRVEQTVGYVDWDPAQRRFEGYQNVEVCAPVLGCMDATRQRLVAVGRESDPADPWGLSAGDYPIVRALSVEATAEESAYSLTASLPPITVITPYGPIEVVPELSYGTDLHTVDTLAFADGAHDVWPIWWIPLDDLYGRQSEVLVTELAGVYGGFSSQLGFGGRDGRSDAPLFVPSGSPPHRADLDFALPRVDSERRPVVSFSAGAVIRYDPIDKLPSVLRSYPFSPTFSIEVEPVLEADYAAQLLLLTRDARRLSGDLGDHDTSRSQAFVGQSAAASASATIWIRIDLVISVSTPFGDDEIVSLHPRIEVPLGGSDPEPQTRIGQALVTGTPTTGGGVQHVTTLRTDDLDPLAFMNECLEIDPPAAGIPPAQHEPGSGEEAVPGLYPCNICVWHGDVSTDEVDLPADGEHLFPFGRPTWACTQSSNGCFDLCDWNGETGSFTSKVSGPHCYIPIPR